MNQPLHSPPSKLLCKRKKTYSDRTLRASAISAAAAKWWGRESRAPRAAHGDVGPPALPSGSRHSAWVCTHGKVGGRNQEIPLPPFWQNCLGIGHYLVFLSHSKMIIILSINIYVCVYIYISF